MSERGKARRRLQPARGGPALPAAPPTPQDADAVNPALFESKEREAAANADPSVEDPLQDWLELETEKDRWLLERNGEGKETPDR